MGCQRGKITINVNDIIGKRLGELKIVCYAGHKYDITSGGLRMRHYYVCRCSCGQMKIVRRSSLKSDKVYSCKHFLGKRKKKGR